MPYALRFFENHGMLGFRQYPRRTVVGGSSTYVGAILERIGRDRLYLGAFVTTCNETVLHTGERILPRSTAARAAWNYHLDDCHSSAARTTLTYSMNRLQRLDSDREYQVTLNRSAEIDSAHVIRRIAVAHALVEFESLAAQESLPALHEVRRTAFAGAWQGFGFHEDGLVSGLRAAEAFGVVW